MEDTDIQAVDTPAPDANVLDAETPIETSADPSPAVVDTDESEVKPKGITKRIDELTRLRRDAERKAEYWENEALRMQSRVPEPPKPPESHKPKTLADFDYDEGAFQSHLFDQATAKATAAARAEIENDRKAAEERRRSDSFDKKERDFAKAHPDYFEKALGRNPEIDVSRASPFVREAILESDIAPELTYYMGSNRDIAETILSLPPAVAVREIGRLEERIKNERERAEAARKQVPKAPPPLPKLDAADAAPVKDPSEMSDAEWDRHAKRLANLKQFKRKG